MIHKKNKHNTQHIRSEKKINETFGELDNIAVIMKQYETTTRTVFENRVQIDEHTKGELVKYVNHHHGSEQTKKLQK